MSCWGSLELSRLCGTGSLFIGRRLGDGGLLEELSLRTKQDSDKVCQLGKLGRMTEGRWSFVDRLARLTKQKEEEETESPGGRGGKKKS